MNGIFFHFAIIIDSVSKIETKIKCKSIFLFSISINSYNILSVNQCKGFDVYFRFWGEIIKNPNIVKTIVSIHLITDSKS